MLSGCVGGQRDSWRTEEVRDFSSREETGQRANNEILLNLIKADTTNFYLYAWNIPDTFLIEALYKNCKVVIFFIFEEEANAQRSSVTGQAPVSHREEGGVEV